MTESATLNPQAQWLRFETRGQAMFPFDPSSVNHDFPGQSPMEHIAGWRSSTVEETYTSPTPTLMVVPGAVITYRAEPDTSIQSDTTIEDSHQSKI